ncbi:hypothetical protein ACJMK2_012582 [Sinanodonta woodiana]|uniref:Novel STAND NTPase 3 domain-containing protein n=1 Tax=Sinanodonta woodiana TaxID=1069815 RepID=A0ABD3VAL8_SINWO
MIRLLKDLKIPGDVISNLETLKKEDIDINFRETEIRLLQETLSGLVNDRNTLKEDMATVQNSVSHLSANMVEVIDRTMETNGKVDAGNADKEEIRKSLDELQVIYDKMMSFLDKNPGILEKEITEKFELFDIDVKELKRNLNIVETELKARVSLMEKHCQKTDLKIKDIEEGMEGVEGTSEKTKEEIRGIKRKLFDLDEPMEHEAVQTEDRLYTLRQLKCIPTNQAEKAKKLLEEKRSIVIKGNPGEGKTTMSLILIENEKYKDKRVVLHSADDWKTVDMEHVNIIVLDDVFGKYDFDHGLLLKWMVYLPTIQEHVDGGRLQVIVTSRVDILSKAKDMLKSLRLFSDDFSLTLSSKNLTKSEKKDILNRELHRHDRNVNEYDKETCIDNFHGLIGFPQCCLLFASDRQLFDRGPKFFTSPKEFFLENITQLDDTRFLSLAFLFCNGEIFEENLSPETMTESSKKLLIDLASRLIISKKFASIELLRNVYDSFGELYVEKSMSYDFSLMHLVRKPRIKFTHPTVSEAVGHVLGERCCEMVVKYGDFGYLYQRTYTAEVKDSTSEKVFLPVYVYGLLAERMVHDVVNRSLVSSVVKHSALKRPDFIKKLKNELNKVNVLKDFFMTGKSRFQFYNLSKGNCVTFMQYILQGDTDVVRLVYSELLEMLACAHNTNNTPDCWRCEEKQNLLELALYYHHFEIADKLITMKACYTHISLCNAARHGDLKRVQTIRESLKKNPVFNPESVEDKLITRKACYTHISLYNAARHGDLKRLQTITESLKKNLVLDPASKEAKYALYRAYVSGDQSLIEFLLKEGIILDSRHVVNAVKHGDMNVLIKVVEHLKCYKWNPMCDDASEALANAINGEKYDVYDLLVQNGISLKMKNLPFVIMGSHISLEFLKKVIQYMKYTDNWDPKCDDASEALVVAIYRKKDDVYDLLVQDGVSLKMKSLLSIITEYYEISLESVKKVIQHLKDTDNWDPKCDVACEALEVAVCDHDVFDLLVQEGVSLQMKSILNIITDFYEISLESVEKVIQHLKDTNNWDPKCDDASKALENAINGEKYDVFDLLIQNGVSLKMKNLPGVIMDGEEISLSLQNLIQNMKDTDNWDPKCDDASDALEVAIYIEKYDVCDLLVQDGVSLKIKNLPGVIMGVDEISIGYVMKAIQHLKDTDSWDPKCDDASKALETAIREHEDDISDLLVQNGVTLEMKNLPSILIWYSAISLEFLQKVIQQMKETDKWDPTCDDASEALQNAINIKKYDVYDLLVQHGVSLKMKNLPSVLICCDAISLEFLQKVIQQMKETDKWDPKCDDASEALKNVINRKKYDAYDLLVQHGVSLKMKNLTSILIWYNGISLEFLQKVIQEMKETDKWDPTCDDGSKALINAINIKKYNVFDLLVQNGVSLKMKNLPGVIKKIDVEEISLKSLQNLIKNMKETDNWDPKCNDASDALEIAIFRKKDDVYDLLVQEGVSLKMKNLPGVIMGVDEISMRYVMKAIQNLKDTDSWDPKCDDASKALETAISEHKYDVSDFLVQNGVSLEMKNLLGVISKSKIVLVEHLQKVIQQMKDTDSWDPKCDSASEALELAIKREKYDVFHLLIQNWVSLKMKNLPSILIWCDDISLEFLQKVIQQMKETDNWDPTCDDASEALKVAINRKKYDVFHLLVQHGVSLKMKNLPSILIWCDDISLEFLQKVIQQMKESDNWDPTCDDASEALKVAINRKKYDVFHLLVQHGVS